MPYLSALEVCSWRGAIPIHLYLYLYNWPILPPQHGAGLSKVSSSGNVHLPEHSNLDSPIKQSKTSQCQTYTGPHWQQHKCEQNAAKITDQQVLLEATPSKYAFAVRYSAPAIVSVTVSLKSYSFIHSAYLLASY